MLAPFVLVIEISSLSCSNSPSLKQIMHICNDIFSWVHGYIQMFTNSGVHELRNIYEMCELLGTKLFYIQYVRCI